MITKFWAMALIVFTYVFMTDQAAASMVPLGVYEALEIKAEDSIPGQLSEALWEKAFPVEDIPQLVSALMDDSLDPIVTAAFLHEIEVYRQLKLEQI